MAVAVAVVVAVAVAVAITLTLTLTLALTLTLTLAPTPTLNLWRSSGRGAKRKTGGVSEARRAVGEARSAGCSVTRRAPVHGGST